MQTKSITVQGRSVLTVGYTPGVPPDLGTYPTITSVKDGNWSDPTVWDRGRVPYVGDVVGVKNSVTYDTNDTTTGIAVVSVRAGSTLSFRSDIQTGLLVTTLQVYGTLVIGTTAAPVTASAQIVFADVPLNTTTDPEQYGNGLLIMSGAVVRMRGDDRTTILPLAAEPKAGDTTLSLAAPANGWQVGVLCYLADTRELDWNQRGNSNGPYSPQWELPTVSSVSADGLTLALNRPLSFSHPGGQDCTGSLRALPHIVAQFSNVTLRSSNAAGHRAYLFATGRADVDIQNCTIGGFGRTKWTVARDNTTFSSDSKTVTHVGTNQYGRFPVHFYKLLGPTAPQANGYQFTFRNNVVLCPLTPMPFMWGVTINQSHYGLVEGNVLVNWGAAGIATVMGNEKENVIQGNFVSRISGTGDRDQLGLEGSGYWIRGPLNRIRNNIAAGPIQPGGVYSYGFIYQQQNVPTPQLVPAAQGAEPSVSVNLNAVTLTEVSGNESYGAVPNGVSYWWINQIDVNPQNAPSGGVIANQAVWNIYQWVVFGYESNRLTLDGWRVFGDRNLLYAGNAAQGFYFGDYQQTSLTVSNCEIHNQQIGILAPVKTGTNKTTGGTTFTVKDCKLGNKTDIAVPTPWDRGAYSGWLAPVTVQISDCTHLPVPGLASKSNIGMWYTALPGTAENLIVSVQTVVSNYNGTGQNYRVYFTQQAASFVVPQSVKNSDGSVRMTGSPVSGLTNQQNWIIYGIAIAGAIAPEAATTVAGIDGLATLQS